MAKNSQFLPATAKGSKIARNSIFTAKTLILNGMQ
jgi:hypothetical protein